MDSPHQIAREVSYEVEFQFFLKAVYPLHSHYTRYQSIRLGKDRQYYDNWNRYSFYSTQFNKDVGRILAILDNICEHCEEEHTDETEFMATVNRLNELFMHKFYRYRRYAGFLDQTQLDSVYQIFDAVYKAEFKVQSVLIYFGTR
jgi:hypothetical protein